MTDYFRWKHDKEEARRAPAARHARPLRDENPPAREEPYRPPEPIEVVEEKNSTTMVQRIRLAIAAHLRGDD